MRKVWLLAAALLCAAAAAQVPKKYPDSFRVVDLPWLATPTATLQVRWVRVQEHPQIEVRDGVCVIYAPARSEADLENVERLLDACVATGAAPARGPVPGTVQLHWHRVAGFLDVSRRGDELFGHASRGFADGVYYHPDPNGPCHIVTARGRRDAGHELLHCIDGYFHNANGSWKDGTNPGRGGTR